MHHSQFQSSFGGPRGFSSQRTSTSSPRVFSCSYTRCSAPHSMYSHGCSASGDSCQQSAGFAFFNSTSAGRASAFPPPSSSSSAGDATPPSGGQRPYQSPSTSDGLGSARKSRVFSFKSTASTGTAIPMPAPQHGHNSNVSFDWRAGRHCSPDEHRCSSTVQADVGSSGVIPMPPPPAASSSCSRESTSAAIPMPAPVSCGSASSWSLVSRNAGLHTPTTRNFSLCQESGSPLSGGYVGRFPSTTSSCSDSASSRIAGNCYQRVAVSDMATGGTVTSVSVATGTHEHGSITNNTTVTCSPVDQRLLTWAGVKLLSAFSLVHLILSQQQQPDGLSLCDESDGGEFVHVTEMMESVSHDDDDHEQEDFDFISAETGNDDNSEDWVSI